MRRESSSSFALVSRRRRRRLELRRARPACRRAAVRAAGSAPRLRLRERAWESGSGAWRDRGGRARARPRTSQEHRRCANHGVVPPELGCWWREAVHRTRASAERTTAEMPGLDDGLERAAAVDEKEHLVARRPRARSASESASPCSGPSTKKAVERMSATSADGATTVAEPKSGAGSPVRGSRMWPIRRPVDVAAALGVARGRSRQVREAELDDACCCAVARVRDRDRASGLSSASRAERRGPGRRDRAARSATPAFVETPAAGESSA